MTIILNSLPTHKGGNVPCASSQLHEIDAFDVCVWVNVLMCEYGFMSLFSNIQAIWEKPKWSSNGGFWRDAQTF